MTELIAPVLAAVKWCYALLCKGAEHMFAWLKLFANAPANLAKVRQAAELEMAEKYDIPLCHCSLPPTVMNKESHQGMHEAWRCPACRQPRQYTLYEYGRVASNT